MHLLQFISFFCHPQVFISYVTATANDVCKDKKRATLSADDVLTALEETDFAELLPPLKEAYEGEQHHPNMSGCITQVSSTLSAAMVAVAAAAAADR